MSPISPISTGAAAPLRPASTPVNQVGLGQAGGANDVAFSAPGLLTSPTDLAPQLTSTLSQLLQGAGSGLDGGQSLKALFTLLVILALFQQLEQNTSGGQDAMKQLDSGMKGRNQSIEMYSSTTSITFEQTTTMISLGNADVSNAIGGGSNAGATGQNIDVAA